MKDEDLGNIEAWLSAIESMIALMAPQLSPDARSRFAAALRQLEATAPELNARLNWSAALNRVRLLIGDEDEKQLES
jgi:hypothetical protein